MDCLCPYCADVFEVPDIYKGKSVKCKNCKHSFEAQVYVPPPLIVPSRILPATGNLFTKLWHKSPYLFRAGFLVSLGVISAVLFTFKFWSYWPKKQPIAPLDVISFSLEPVKLFRVNSTPLIGVIRGRTLNYYEFSSDATRPNSSLCVWVNDSGVPIAVSAKWIGTYFGTPVGVIADKMEYYCSSSVCDGFKKLIGCEPFSINYEVAAMADGTISWLHQKDKWVIDARRSEVDYKHEFTEMSKSVFLLEAKIHELDPNKIPLLIYSFTTVAKTW